MFAKEVEVTNSNVQSGAFLHLRCCIDHTVNNLSVIYDVSKQHVGCPVITKVPLSSLWRIVWPVKCRIKLLIFLWHPFKCAILLLKIDVITYPCHDNKHLSMIVKGPKVSVTTHTILPKVRFKPKSFYISFSQATNPSDLSLSRMSDGLPILLPD